MKVRIENEPRGTLEAQRASEESVLSPRIDAHSSLAQSGFDALWLILNAKINRTVDRWP